MILSSISSWKKMCIRDSPYTERRSAEARPCKEIRFQYMSYLHRLSCGWQPVSYTHLDVYKRQYQNRFAISPAQETSAFTESTAGKSKAPLLPRWKPKSFWFVEIRLYNAAGICSAAVSYTHLPFTVIFLIFGCCGVTTVILIFLTFVQEP